MNDHERTQNLIIRRIGKTPHIPGMVVEQIIGMIADGVLKAGDKLPSELEMTRRFGISRISLREAMKLLEAKGYIESLGRKGKRVRSVVENALITPIAGLLSNDPGKVWELFQVRKIIDSEAAYIAAYQGSAEQLGRLQGMMENCERMGIDHLLSKKESGILYCDFYKCLGEATNNTVFAHLMRSVSSMLRAALPGGRTMLGGIDGSSRAIYEQHVSLVAALRNRKQKEAKNAIIDHIDWLEAALRSVVK